LKLPFLVFFSLRKWFAEYCWSKMKAALLLLLITPEVAALTVQRPKQLRNGQKPRVVMLNALHRRQGQTDPECGSNCAVCRPDSDNPNNAHCHGCSAGYGLEHDYHECRDHLNCRNNCIPCTDSNCAECSTNAGKCDVYKDGSKPSGAVGPKHSGAKDKKEESVTDAVTGGVTDTASGVEDVGGEGMDAASDKLDEASDPAGMAEKSAKEVSEGNFENVHVLLNPATAVSGAMAAGGIIAYILVVCCCGFCYTKVKPGYLNDWNHGSLPRDGFADGIFTCKTDSGNMSICFWSCCCPCIRWADTIADMGYMRFYVALAIWVLLTVGNSFLMGCGSLLIIGIGSWYRMKIRGSWGLQSNACADVFAWCCCLPCAVAQEARQVERSRSMNVKQIR